jgi:hypothetical protein
MWTIVLTAFRWCWKPLIQIQAEEIAWLKAQQTEKAVA